MELLRGADFRQVLRDRGALPVPDVITYGAQMCAGLAARPRARARPPDIKPENLMLCPRASSRICDFGLVTHHNGSVTRYTDRSRGDGLAALLLGARAGAGLPR